MMTRGSYRKIRILTFLQNRFRGRINTKKMLAPSVGRDMRCCRSLQGISGVDSKSDHRACYDNATSADDDL